MQEEEALEFYDRITGGTESYETISLEHSSGSTLTEVEMHPVDKRTLASVIERLPEQMFEAAEDVDVDNLEEAEEELDTDGDMASVTEDTVDAFEDLCCESLDHPELTNTQMNHIVFELDFETLFALGSEIIEMSVENTGAVRDFQKQI